MKGRGIGHLEPQVSNIQSPQEVMKAMQHEIVMLNATTSMMIDHVHSVLTLRLPSICLQVNNNLSCPPLVGL